MSGRDSRPRNFQRRNNFRGFHNNSNNFNSSLQNMPMSMPFQFPQQQYGYQSMLPFQQQSFQPANGMFGNQPPSMFGQSPDGYSRASSSAHKYTDKDVPRKPNGDIDWAKTVEFADLWSKYQKEQKEQQEMRRHTEMMQNILQTFRTQLQAPTATLQHHTSSQADNSVEIMEEEPEQLMTPARRIVSRPATSASRTISRLPTANLASNVGRTPSRPMRPHVEEEDMQHHLTRFQTMARSQLEMDQEFMSIWTQYINCPLPRTKKAIIQKLTEAFNLQE